MRNQKCPKCNSSNIYFSQDDFLVEVRIDGRKHATVDYICGDCGYYESYFADTVKLRKALEASSFWKKAD
jgi:predicted nucleic-acid-binding Zn-ribbon protein